MVISATGREVDFQPVHRLGGRINDVNETLVRVAQSPATSLSECGERNTVARHGWGAGLACDASAGAV